MYINYFNYVYIITKETITKEQLAGKMKLNFISKWISLIHVLYESLIHVLGLRSWICKH